MSLTFKLFSVKLTVLLPLQSLSDTPEDFKSAVLEATMYDPDSRPSFADLAEHFEILTKDLEAMVAEEKKNTPRSALEKFRSKAAALTVPLIEKVTPFQNQPLASVGRVV